MKPSIHVLVLFLSNPPKENIGTQGVQELFFVWSVGDRSIYGTVMIWLIWQVFIVAMLDRSW